MEGTLWPAAGFCIVDGEPSSVAFTTARARYVLYVEMR